MNTTIARRPSAAGKARGRLVGGFCLLALLGAMVWDTQVVEIGADVGAQENVFSAKRFGEKQFPIIRKSVESRAIEADKLAQAVLDDATAAGEKYGVGDGIGPVVPVTFSGVVNDGRSGIYTVDAQGVPDSITVRVQTGPAINGTALRDATGKIAFGQFTNQIEYQNAGAGINQAMKNAVLADVDTENLSGKTVTVTGVFKLINPKNWLVTPVRMDVE